MTRSTSRPSFAARQSRSGFFWSIESWVAPASGIIPTRMTVAARAVRGSVVSAASAVADVSKERLVSIAPVSRGAFANTYKSGGGRACAVTATATATATARARVQLQTSGASTHHARGRSSGDSVAGVRTPANTE